MADDVTLPGTGSVVATDEVDLGGGAAHVQFVKLVDGTEDGTDRIPGSAARGLSVDPRPKVVRKTATPTISTTAYAAKDAVGGLLTFAGAARASGGSIEVVAAQLVDFSGQNVDLELVLFDRSITAPTDNAVFDPTDAELAYVVGSIFFASGFYSIFSDNGVATVDSFRLPAVLNGTDLYGVIVARGAPTFGSTGDLSVALTIRQD